MYRCWSNSKKWTVTDVLSATGFNRIMVSTIMAPALSTISKELDMNSVEAVMALSAFMLATAFGPIVIGPLSEVYGRKPILHASNIWFLIWNLVCGFANSKGLLIASRFLAGFGASAIYSLAGGVLGDVWRPEQRGRSLGIYLLIPLLGAAVGPIIGGFMAARTTWRWMFWATSAFQGVMIVISIPAFHETYGPLILHRRAEKLRLDSGEQRYHTAVERLDANKSISGIVRQSLTRPLRLLFFHPIIQIMAFLSAFNYGVLYIVLSTFSDMWVTKYHESVEISGLHYIAIALGEIIGSQIGGPLMDYIFGKLKNRASGEIAPEYHLPLMLPGGILGPLGLIMYGWCAQFNVQWSVVDIGAFIACFGMQIMGQPIQAYVIDAYPDHTSSATAASQFIRSLTAFSFPLFAPKVYSALGYGWGNTTVAFIALAIGIPAPLLLWKFGPGLRTKARSSY
jgi:multidrug resistance protein